MCNIRHQHRASIGRCLARLLGGACIIVAALCRASAAAPSAWSPPPIDVQVYGASGSHRITTANCTAMSTSVALSSPLDFVNGQGIALLGCGTAAPAAASGASVSSSTGSGPATYVYSVASCDSHLGYSGSISASSITGNASLGPASSGRVYNLISWTPNGAGDPVCVYRNYQLAINGAANNGSGLIRLTVGATGGLYTGETLTVSGVVGTTEANGTWTVTVIDATHVDLQASSFVHNYTSGGTISTGALYVARTLGFTGTQDLVSCSPGPTCFIDTFPNNYLYFPALWPAAPPSVSRADALVTSIAAGAGGTNITVANAAATTATGMIAIHEDTAAIQTALGTCGSLAPAGSSVSLPAGMYNVSALSVTSGCTFQGAGVSSTWLFTYTDDDTITVTAPGDTTIRDLSIISWDLSSKANGYCINASSGYHVFLFNQRCQGFNGYRNFRNGSFIVYNVYLDQMMGSYGFLNTSDGGAPSVRFDNVGSTTGSLPHTMIKWVDMDSFTSGLFITYSNFSRGGWCFYEDDSVASGSSYPKWAWLNNFGCDHPYHNAIELRSGLDTIINNSYIGSSLTGHGVVANSNWLGSLAVGPNNWIEANASHGVSIEAGTDSQIVGSQIVRNSALGGNSEVSISAGISGVTIVGNVINRVGHSTPTSDTNGISVATGSGDYIVIAANNFSSGTGSQNVSMLATGAHNVQVANVGDFSVSQIFAPGTNTASTWQLGYAFNTNWPAGIASIYDNANVDYWQCYGTALTGGTRTAPTFTGGAGPNLGCLQYTSGNAGGVAALQMASVPNGSAKSPTDLFTLDLTNSRLGVLTTSPGYALDVNGTGHVSGALTASASVTLSGLSTTPGGKQPLCIDTATGTIYKGSGGAC
ncbi:MAG TPA: hypothetical protein VF007_03930 [Stellaceae bacterium]